MVDGMLRRSAGKSVRYAGELVVPEPLYPVRRYLPFKTASGNSQRRILWTLEPVPVIVHTCWRPDWAAVAEY